MLRFYKQNDSPQDLERAIIYLVAFFDLFEYPLTPQEIWHYLDEQVEAGNLAATLERLTNHNSQYKLSSANGFYFLPGSERSVITRQRRHNYSQRKIKIAKRFGFIFQLCPFVKTVAIANSMGGYNLRDGSDIDFFIITSARRIWLARLFCAGLAKILHQRPVAGKKRDRICLSFYISSEHLCLADLQLPDYDPYFHYWQRSLILLYNKNRQFEKFLQANHLPIAQEYERGGRPRKKLFFGLRKVGDLFEKLAKKLQIKIMPPGLSRQNGQGGVVYSDNVIKLYLLDRRQEFLDKYAEKIRPFA